MSLHTKYHRLMLCSRQKCVWAKCKWRSASTFTGSHKTVSWNKTWQPCATFYLTITHQETVIIDFLKGIKKSCPPQGQEVQAYLLYMFMLLLQQPWCAVNGGGALEIRRGWRGDVCKVLVVYFFAWLSLESTDSFQSPVKCQSCLQNPGSSRETK